MKTSATLFLFLLLLSSSVRGQLPPAYTDRLNVVFDSVCTKYNLVGASAAIYVPNVGGWTGVHGMSHPGTPVTENMLFGIGSNTKTMVAAALLKLQEQQLLDLDDTIGEWVSNKPNIDGQVTIRQCLNHSSGIFSFTEHEDFEGNVFNDYDRIWTLDEILTMVDEPYFPKGTGWEYSNTNYIIAGIIIEKVTGKNMQTALRDLVFTPAGLNKSYYYPQETPAEPIAHNWSTGITGTKLTDAFTIQGYSLNSLFSTASSAGCVMQTASDNVQFWQKLMGGQIINATSLAEMKQLKSIGGGQGYGLGIFRVNNIFNGRSIYSHGGTNFGYIAENAVDMVSGICFSVLTNQDSIDNGTLLLDVIGALHKVGMEMGITHVPQVAAQAGISVYPNPASSVIRLEHPAEMQTGTVELYDMTGKMKMSRVGINEPLSLAELAPGCYLLRVLDEQGGLVHQQLISKQ